MHFIVVDLCLDVTMFMSSGYFHEKQKENIKPKERLSCSPHHLLITYFIFLANLNLSVSLVHYMLQISLIAFFFLKMLN